MFSKKIRHESTSLKLNKNVIDNRQLYLSNYPIQTKEKQNTTKLIKQAIKRVSVILTESAGYPQV